MNDICWSAIIGTILGIVTGNWLAFEVRGWLEFRQSFTKFLVWGWWHE